MSAMATRAVAKLGRDPSAESDRVCLAPTFMRHAPKPRRVLHPRERQLRVPNPTANGARGSMVLLPLRGFAPGGRVGGEPLLASVPVCYRSTIRSRRINSTHRWG